MQLKACFRSLELTAQACREVAYRDDVF